MIISIEELKKYINTTDSDEVLEMKLQALEVMVREYTNNNFQKRAYRRTADIVGGLFVCEALVPFKVGDTVQICSKYNDGLYTIETVDDATFTVKEEVMDEDDVLVTLVHYPTDVKLGVVNMFKWDMEKKVGVQSETISRHSVTYFNMDGDNSTMGYPKSLMGFLKPYMKARF
jgi:hypothetical protein